MTTTATTTTTTTARPVPLRLPGQAAAPEGPVDLSMMYVMHHAFRRDLKAFAAAAARTPVAARSTWRALAQRWALFSQALHHHHSGEDAGLWPLLTARAGAAGRRTLAAMEAEHAEIDPVLAACAAGFERLAGHADEDARAALAVRLAAAREALARHLQHEERDALALVQRLMTQEEWAAVQEEHFASGMPLSQVIALVPWAVHGMPEEARGRLFAASGSAHRVMWLATRRGFERRERLAFRYVD